MKRSAAITVVAIISILGSMLMLAIGTLMFFVPRIPSSGVQEPEFARQMIHVSAGLFLVLALWGIATAIGLIRFQRWSRISVLLFSGLLVLVAVPALVFVLAMPLPMPGDSPKGMGEAVKLFVGIFYALLAVLGGWWLILFNRKAVREQFGQARSPSSRKPISITIIGWFLVLGAAMCVVTAVLHWPAVLFGTVVTAWAATALYVACAIAQAAIGIELLRLREAGRIAAICYFLLAFLNMLVFVALPGREERWVATTRAVATVFGTPPQPAPPSAYSTGLIIYALFTLVPLWFLFRRKEAFATPPGETA